jgi:hypothetical protein
MTLPGGRAVGTGLRAFERRQLDQVVRILDAEHLTEHVQHGRMEVLHPALRLHETKDGALADALLTGQSPLHFDDALGELRRGRSGRARRRHEFRQSQSHVQHSTTVTNVTVIVNSYRLAAATGLALLTARKENRILGASSSEPFMELHIAKEYETGIGHIEERLFGEGRYLVSFYAAGGRVRQEWEETLEMARFTVRQFSRRAQHGHHFPL